MSGPGHLAPLIVPEARGFWDGLAAGVLRVQRCNRCQHARFPTRPMCAECHATSSSWTDVAPNGTIWSFIAPHPPLLPAFDVGGAFNVTVVQLDDEPNIRMVGNVIDDRGFVDGRHLTVGQPVELVIVEPEPGLLLPRWRLT